MNKYESYLNSPYKVEGIIERGFVTKEDETLTVDPETGQYYTIRKVSKDKKVLHDPMSYTKVFASGFAKMMSISPSSMKVLMYAMCTVKPFSELVILHQPDVCIACGFSNSTFINAINDLLDKNIISKKLGSKIEFWFDPNIFFNGNRLRIYK